MSICQYSSSPPMLDRSASLKVESFLRNEGLFVSDFSSGVVPATPQSNDLT